MPPKKKAPKPTKVYIINDLLNVVPIANKGNELGVRTTVDLAPNSRPIYEGKTITQAEYDKLEKQSTKHPDKKLIAYIMASGNKGTYIDANPRYAGSADWIAGRVNEPATKEHMWLAHEKNANRNQPVLITRNYGSASYIQ